MASETVFHLFYDCDHIKPVWDMVQQWLDGYVSPCNKLDRFTIVYNSFKPCKDNNVNNMLLLIVNLVKSQIWKFRNTAKHEKKKFDMYT